MSNRVKAIVAKLVAYLQDHVFGAIVTLLASAVISATGAVVVPASNSTVNGWRDETRDIFTRIEFNSTLRGQTVNRDWGSVELFWNDALTPSVHDLQKAVLRTRSGTVADFYFSDGDVVFVYRRGPDGKPAREADDGVGDRFYFRRGARYRLFFSKQRMIYWIAPGKRVVSPDHIDFGAAERTILAHARAILGVARHPSRGT